jgi:hypothetical protein
MDLVGDESPKSSSVDATDLDTVPRRGRSMTVDVLRLGSADRESSASPDGLRQRIAMYAAKRGIRPADPASPSSVDPPASESSDAIPSIEVSSDASLPDSPSTPSKARSMFKKAQLVARIALSIQRRSVGDTDSPSPRTVLPTFLVPPAPDIVATLAPFPNISPFTLPPAAELEASPPPPPPSPPPPPPPPLPPVVLCDICDCASFRNHAFRPGVCALCLHSHPSFASPVRIAAAAAAHAAAVAAQAAALARKLNVAAVAAAAAVGSPDLGLPMSPLPPPAKEPAPEPQPVVVEGPAVERDVAELVNSAPVAPEPAVVHVSLAELGVATELVGAAAAVGVVVAEAAVAPAPPPVRPLDFLSLSFLTCVGAGLGGSVFSQHQRHAQWSAHLTLCSTRHRLLGV